MDSGDELTKLMQKNELLHIYTYVKIHVRKYSDTYGEERISCICTPDETS